MDELACGTRVCHKTIDEGHVAPKMLELHLAEVENLIFTLPSQYYRLLLIVGPTGSGKTRILKGLSRSKDIPYVNLNLALSQRLLDVDHRERPLRVHHFLADVIDEQSADVVILDNIELLFEPTLHQDPLACLQGSSRNKALIVSWGGKYVGSLLTYAEPGHPEYRRYDRPDAVIVALPS